MGTVGEDNLATMMQLDNQAGKLLFGLLHNLDVRLVVALHVDDELFHVVGKTFRGFAPSLWRINRHLHIYKGGAQSRFQSERNNGLTK